MPDNLFRRLVLAALLALLLTACSSAQYAVMEKFGIHKREILVDRVEDARDSQEEAKQQFASALEEFSAVLNFQGGTLEEKYTQLNTELEASEEHARDVSTRIDEVEDVAEALFDEWEDELKLYSSDSLRRSSAGKLEQTRNRYQNLMKSLKPHHLLSRLLRLNYHHQTAAIQKPRYLPRWLKPILQPKTFTAQT